MLRKKYARELQGGVKKAFFLEPRETVASGDTHPHKKTMYPCIVETQESTRKRLESTRPRNHDDHIAEKGFNSLIHNNLVHKIHSNAPSDENSGCEGCSEKRMREARENPCVADGKSEEQKGCCS